MVRWTGRSSEVSADPNSTNCSAFRGYSQRKEPRGILTILEHARPFEDVRRRIFRNKA